MKENWRTELPHWIVLILLAAATAWALAVAPDRIPTHWNIRGEVDGWGNKWFGLLLSPIIAAVVYLLMRYLPRIDPLRNNYEKFRGAYHVVRLTILLILAVIQGVLITTAVGYQVNVGVWIMSGIGVLLAILGWVMGDIKPNWFVGVRTPWTLSSRVSWTKTHRQARWIFMLSGLAFVIAGVVQNPPVFFVAVGFVLTGTVWLVVYSYLVWRSDPDRNHFAEIKNNR